MNNTGSFLIFFLLNFFIFLISEAIIIEMLRNKFESIYEKLGRPIIGWAGFRNINITWSFIFMRKFRNYELDVSINFWCNVGCISLLLMCLSPLMIVLIPWCLAELGNGASGKMTGSHFEHIQSGMTVYATRKRRWITRRFSRHQEKVLLLTFL